MIEFRTFFRLSHLKASFLVVALLTVAMPLALADQPLPTTDFDTILARGNILVGTCGDYKPW